MTQSITTIDPTKTYYLQTDGSFKHSYYISLGGGVLLDEENNTIDSFVDFLPNNIPHDFHEYFALAHCLEKSLLQGIKKISVQTDCLNLVHDIKKQNNLIKLPNPYIDNILKNLNLMEKINQFDRFNIKYVPRKQNSLANSVVNDFFNYHLTNKTLAFAEIPKHFYLNREKVFHTGINQPDTKELKNIQDQVVFFLTFNNIDKMNIKLLHYSSPDLQHLKKETNIVLPSKKWIINSLEQIHLFLEGIDVQNIRVSCIGQDLKLQNIIRPNSELLDINTRENMLKLYTKFNTIYFSTNGIFCEKIKEKYQEQIEKFNQSKELNNNNTKNKQFLYLAMRCLGEENQANNQFFIENKDNYFVIKSNKLPLAERQKFFFEKFANITKEKNIEAYLRKKENLAKNGVNFKF